jgi:hypothetical protein
MCIFYRNPKLDERFYEACRSGDHSVYGDATSPRREDPVWNDLMQRALVEPVLDYIEKHREEFKLGEKVRACVRACVRAVGGVGLRRSAWRAYEGLLRAMRALTALT